MTVFHLFGKELVSLATALIGAGVLYLFRARAKLVWAVPHGFTFLLPETAPRQENVIEVGPPGGENLPAPRATAFNVYTGSIFVANTGKLPASEVEVTFNWKPENYNLWPVRPHDIHISPDNRFTLKFLNLAPKEQFQIELIAPTNLPQVLSVSCRECTGKQITMRPMVVYRRWVHWLVFTLMLLGASSVVYVVLKLASIAGAY
jgi:hypothetical protein